MLYETVTYKDLRAVKSRKEERAFAARIRVFTSKPASYWCERCFFFFLCFKFTPCFLFLFVFYTASPMFPQASYVVIAFRFVISGYLYKPLISHFVNVLNKFIPLKVPIQNFLSPG